jgi:hypothetical protein
MMSAIRTEACRFISENASAENALPDNRSIGSVEKSGIEQRPPGSSSQLWLARVRVFLMTWKER